MELEEYQERAMMTCTDESNNFSYMMLNLVGELGEFASKVAKAIRKGEAYIDSDTYYRDDGSVIFRTHSLEGYTDKFETELQKEAGDILWQLSGLCSVMGWNLNDIAEQNLQKLADRKARNVIVGEGDNR